MARHPVLGTQFAGLFVDQSERGGFAGHRAAATRLARGARSALVVLVAFLTNR
jgi:hypothetical protein